MAIEQSKIERWEKELSKCIRCGTCRQFCPIHQVLDDESYTARGKLYMVDQFIHGDFLLSDGFVEMINKCVMCKGCTANCPSGVNTYQIFMEMRQEIVKERGLSFTKQSVFRALQWRKLFDFGLSCGSMFQRLIFKPAPDGHGQIARIPLPMAGLNYRRIIPNLPGKSLKKIVPLESKAKGEEKYRVGFFTGCMINYVYPQIGQDLIDVLNLNGVTVITPQEQQCCATPMFTSGETEIASELIHRNLHVFAKLDIDYIITACSSGGLAWKDEFAKVLGENHPDYALAKELSKKARDISEFLVEIGMDTDKLQPVSKKITYHDSCHLNRGQKVNKQPRQLLKSIPGSTFIEMEKADGCCGSGGSFNLKYYELSREINKQKTAHIADTGADVVAMGCPLCRMHVKDGLSQDGIDIDTRHVIELIAESYGLHENNRRGEE